MQVRNLEFQELLQERNRRQELEFHLATVRENTNQLKHRLALQVKYHRAELDRIRHVGELHVVELQQQIANARNLSQFTVTDSTSWPRRNQPASVGGSGAATSRPTLVVSAQHLVSQRSVGTIQQNIKAINQNVPGGVYHNAPLLVAAETNSKELASNPVLEPSVPPPVLDRVTGMGAANYTGPFVSTSSQGAGQKLGLVRTRE